MSINSNRSSFIDVILVTQCSMDRLPNLQEQLANWKGKASVAVYLKENEVYDDCVVAIRSCIEEAEKRALYRIMVSSDWNVAVTIVQGETDDSSYPINFLRNCALLEAERYEAKCGKSAVLLVDVDFCPSSNLHEALHCQSAAEAILDKGRVVICPAFEQLGESMPRNFDELHKKVECGEAEGFHLSHFPQGHGPTNFDKYWSSSCCYSNIASVSHLWNNSYSVPYEKLFEPYVVLATKQVPLFDERFQGYGLNKVSHIASVAKKVTSTFWVLPGVFLVAPAHERSEWWNNLYGSQSDEAKFNKLLLKGLFHNFSENLRRGKDVVVSEFTRREQAALCEAAESKSDFAERRSLDEEKLLGVLCAIAKEQSLGQKARPLVWLQRDEEGGVLGRDMSTMLLPNMVEHLV
eukprot:CAMPEP_0118694456 /NCGR_PEP_ID=MMETSP0800-20121206/12533_1 /TAXON_ID=210618 ORGANISM="Striatella unipunctata, Strain CCMP2910" /NCGR_SAMPLE_ID=MMETSP0800 /ASSEMBLY_ACC=CAM_ASM_000638 /LENGTH=406 /DNA_ID=CAMNT_0006592923 /DNA_START=141 /DNA_END=1362 /DNA_ORIENTATION=+